MRAVRICVTALGITAAGFALCAHGAEAAMTAADLKELCSGSDHVSRNVCRIYILGLTEGDLVIERPGFRFVFPVTTMLLLSALISLAAWMLRR